MSRCAHQGPCADAGDPSRVSLAIGNATDAADAASLLFVDRVVREVEPYTQVVDFVDPVAPITIVPAGHRVVGHHEFARGARLRACGDGSSVLVIAGPESTAAWVSANSPARLREIVEKIRSLGEHDDHNDRIRLIAWRRSRLGNVRRFRRIEAPAFGEIERNYPTRVRQALVRLARSDPPTESGGLILWHGEPGTGKTRAAIALLREWAPWCEPHLITDPERMFEDADYLLEAGERFLVTRNVSPSASSSRSNDGTSSPPMPPSPRSQELRRSTPLDFAKISADTSITR